MTHRTYKGMVAPSWAKYVVIGPLSGMAYWANNDIAVKIADGQTVHSHLERGWRREELDPLPVEDVWGVFGAGSVVDARMLNTYASEAEALEKASELARGHMGHTLFVARITHKITQPKPELIVEKL